MKKMKKFFNGFFASVMALVVAASCAEKPIEPEKPEEEKTSAKFEFVDAPEKAEFEFGQTKTFTVQYSDIVDFGIEQPEGWTALLEDDKLIVTAPAEDAESYDVEGEIEVKYSGEDGVESVAKLEVVVNIPEGPEEPEDPENPGTPDTPAEPVTFELVYSNVTTTTADLQVIPSNNTVGYYFDVCTEEDFNSVNGNVYYIVSEYMDYLKKAYPSFSMSDILAAMLSYGPDSDTVSGLPAGTTMCFYAVAIDENGEQASEPAVVKFTTVEAGNPAECTFDIEISEIKGTTCLITIQPSDPSVRYWFAVTPVEGYPGDIPMMVAVKEEAAAYASQIGMTLEEVISAVTIAGPVADYWYDLELDTQYYVYAFAMDKNGDYAGPCFKQAFRTAADDISDADLELDYRYFDGDALYAMDPASYPNAQGRVLLQVKASPNYYAYDWAVAVAKGDMTDDTLFPYDATINAMLASGVAKYDQTMQQFWVEWSPCTILAFAADYEGYNGPLHRILVEPTKEGAAELDQLAPLSTTSSAFTAPEIAAPARVSFEGRMNNTPMVRRSLGL